MLMRKKNKHKVKKDFEEAQRIGSQNTSKGLQENNIPEKQWDTAKKKGEKTMKIVWNNFLNIAKREFPKEACALLFSSKPYSKDEKWIVAPLRNVAKEPENNWYPDRFEVLEKKKAANKLELTRIGNIHSHTALNKKEIKLQSGPSKVDLTYARRFNDVIRGIVVVSDKGVEKILFHDKFGRKVNIRGNNGKSLFIQR